MLQMERRLVNESDNQTRKSKAMSPLQIQLLGKLHVQRNDATILGLESRKVQELFCYIVLHRDHTLSREPLASVLWGDCSTAQSKTYLRKALWQLQNALDGAARSPSSNVLVATADTIALHPDAAISIDVAVLEHIFGATRRLPGKMLNAQQAQAIREAVDLYTGNLLEGWYQDWVMYERERVQQIYLTLLNKLMDYCEAHADYASGLEYGERILRYERAHEPTYRQLMLLHALTGDRTAALRQYERCVITLEEEFNIAPDQQTTELYQQLRMNQLGASLALGQPAPVQPESMPLLSQVLDRLTTLEQALSSMHQLVRQDIQRIERTFIRQD